MANWTAEVFENEYLAGGRHRRPRGRDGQLHRRGRRPAHAGRRGRGDHRRHVGFDVVARTRRSPPRAKAAAAAIDEIVDGTWFAVVAGDCTRRRRVYPPNGDDGAGRTTRTREAAKGAVHAPRRADGGTAIGAWFVAADRLFERRRRRKRHAILLTDGKNETEPPSSLRTRRSRLQGVFQCDCRGVGADWEVNELRGISSALLGTVDIIAEPEDMADDFRR